MTTTVRDPQGSGRDVGQQPNEFLLRWAADTLREALSPLDARRYEIFAQGSRANGTWLEPVSDIDLVLVLRAPFLSPLYGWEQFLGDVLATLGTSHAVRMGRRCLNIDDPDSLFGEMVDVLVATEYGAGGVFFRDREGRPIVNFPRQHRINGDRKDRSTGGRFKEVVRLAKRLKKLTGRAESIPSYLLECLLYNVPDDVYRTSSAEDAYRGALEWLRWCHHTDPAAFAAFPCQNGINRLFGPGPDQWTPGEVGTIITVLPEL